MNLLKAFSFLFILADLVYAAPLPCNGAAAQGATSETILDDGSKPGASPLKSNIQIVGRQLQIDGKAFIMKGICYNPVRKGGIYPNDLMTIKPTHADLAAIEKDFQMMESAGINTIRTYIPMVDPHILDLLTKYHLKTIVPVFNDNLESDSEIKTTIAALKNHPSTLIWEIGNEWNFNFFYTQSASNPEGIGLTQSALLLENAAQLVRGMDNRHPISTVIGGLPASSDLQFWTLLDFKGIDLYGINVYSGLTFGQCFTEWAGTKTTSGISTKPLYIAEFGADAYNMNLGPIDPATGKLIGAEDDSSQAFAVNALVNQVLANLSALDPSHVLVGGNLFEWNDEWWKPDNSDPDSHTSTGFPSPGGGPYPDDIFNEKWFGILDIDRNPRPAYYTLQQLYTKPL